MKAQSTIIQFILFFLIGLTIFISVGSLFKYQSDLLRQDVVTASRGLISDYLSSIAVIEYDSCKKCDWINITTSIANTTADYYVEMKFEENSLFVTTQPDSATVRSSASKINESVSLLPSSTSSIQRITLTYDKNKNNIVIQ